eukprot:1361396-Alexandrium_andersonii.AAC.1
MCIRDRCQQSAPAASRPLRIATDFSGMDSALAAARMLGLETERVSYCDSWQPARDWAAANHGLPDR